MTRADSSNHLSGDKLAAQIHRAVSEVLGRYASNGQWRSYTGPAQETLRDRLQRLLGATEVGLASSGSAALELVLNACRMPVDSEVLLAGYDYPGNFSAIERVGARPVLVDVQPHSWALDRSALDEAYRPTCRALIASHLHGQLQDMDALQNWCDARGVFLIQDACQAIGARPSAKPLASVAHATIVSFGGSKLISSGRGGAWCTNDAEFALHARRAAGVGSGVFELSELQAAMVLAQLDFLELLDRCTSNYFESLARRLMELNQSSNESKADERQIHIPWLPCVDQTSFYQAGWILSDDLLAKLSQHGSPNSEDPFGVGFNGYHRRSSRRCRIERTLVNTEQVAKRTRVLHFSLALQNSGISPLEWLIDSGPHSG